MGLGAAIIVNVYCSLTTHHRPLKQTHLNLTFASRLVESSSKVKQMFLCWKSSCTHTTIRNSSIPYVDVCLLLISPQISQSVCALLNTRTCQQSNQASQFPLARFAFLFDVYLKKAYLKIENLRNCRNV